MVLYLSRSGVIILPRRSLLAFAGFAEVALRSFRDTVATELLSALKPAPEPEPETEPETAAEPGTTFDDGVVPTGSYLVPPGYGFVSIMRVPDFETAELVARGVAAGLTTGAPGMFYPGGLGRAVTLRLAARRANFTTNDRIEHLSWRTAANLVYLARDLGVFGLDELGNSPGALRYLFADEAYVDRR